MLHCSAESQLILQSKNLSLQCHQLPLNLLCSGVGLTNLVQNGQVLIGPYIQCSLKQWIQIQDVTQLKC